MSKHSENIAIIGSSGMIGSDLVQFLKPSFPMVTGITRENYETHRGQHFDAVINANGNSNKIWANKNVQDDFEASVISVYDSLYSFPSKLYIYLSSSDVYEDHTNTNTTHESKSIHPEKISTYGFHKYLSECIVRNASKNYIILRCPLILGTHLKKGPIYDILQKSRLFVSEKSAFQMITTIELANIINFLLKKNISNETFNIGGQGTVSLNEIITYVKHPVEFPKDGEIHKYLISVAKLNKIYHLKKSREYLQDLLKTIK